MPSKSNTALMAATERRIERRAQLSAALIRQMGIPVEAWTRYAVHAMVSNPDLADCDPASFDRALIRSIDAGVIPDGRQAVIYPFVVRGVKMAQLVIMIAGRIELARRATPGVALDSRVVYECDEWDWIEGAEPVLRHRPNGDGPHEPRDIIAAWATARMPGAPHAEREVMLRYQIDRVRTRSRSGDKGPWATDLEEMIRKTVLGRLLKRLPRGTLDPPDHDDGAGEFLPAPGAEADAEAVVVDQPADQPTEPEQPGSFLTAEAEAKPPPKARPSRAKKKPATKPADTADAPAAQPNKPPSEEGSPFRGGAAPASA